MAIKVPFFRQLIKFNPGLAILFWMVVLGLALTLATNRGWIAWGSNFLVATVDARALMSAAPNRYEFGTDPKTIAEAGEQFGSFLQEAVRTVAHEEGVVILAAGATLSENVPDFTNIVQLLVDRRMQSVGFPVKSTVAEEENRDATRVSLDSN